MADGARGIFSVRRLRWLMVAGALVLVGVLAGYIGYARYLRGKFRIKLPKGTGLTIDSTGVTFASTDQGRTKFTVHAAKRLDMQDGKVKLYDVGIVLYGANGDRSDHISGNEFEWDPKQGVMAGVGDVYIDMEPPRAKDGATAAKGDAASRTIHMKTSGLVFRQKEQVASTENGIEFRVQGMTGTALGASYDSVNGIIVLEREVRVSGLRGGGTGGVGRPTVLTASHAELDMEDDPQQAGNVAFLHEAKLVETGDRGAETAAAKLAVVHMSSDGTPKRIDAKGDVVLTGDGRGRVTSDAATLDLNPAGLPVAAHWMGAVRYGNDEEGRQESGSSDDARVAFDGQGRPVHAVMLGGVVGSVVQGAGSRRLQADTVEMALAGGGKEPVEVRSAEATAKDGARMQLVDAVARKDAKGKAMPAIETTNVRADVLDAQFQGAAGSGAKKSELTGVDGRGKTLVERTSVASAGGAVMEKETGTGDALRLDFAEAAAGKDALIRAEQRGGVKVVYEAASKAKNAKPGTMDVEHAEGEDAVYEAAGDRMTMTGGVRVADAESALFADRVQMDRGTGDGVAEGAVRVSYVQPGSSGEPMHVLAARAVGHKASGVTEFFAAPGGLAKMWQGGSQVEAPVLDFDRTKKVVVAHGSGDGAEVKTVLVDESAKAVAKRQANVPVRVWSRTLTYTDATRQAVFDGLVRVEEQDGTMRAREATVFLAPKDAGAALHPTSRAEAARDGAPGGSGVGMELGGKVDHIVATGGVEIDQPGRKATGERLVYTQADRVSVLTGTKAAPPKMVDETQGMVTGSALRFKSGDDSVEVLSGDGVEKVHSETRMKQKP